MEGIPYREAEFEVGLQPQVAELALEARFAPFRGVARSECPYRPTAHAVAASHVEHAVDGEGGGVAVGEPDAAEEAVDHCRPVTDRDGVADAGVHAEILRVADAEYLIEGFFPGRGLAARAAVVDVHLLGDGRGEPVGEGVGQVARGFRIDAQGERIALGGIGVVEQIGAGDGRDVLRTVALAQVAILDGAEKVGVDETHVHQVEVDGAHRVGGVAAVVPRVADVGTGDGTVVFRLVLQVGRHLHAGEGAEELARPVDGKGGEEAREGDRRRHSHLVGVLGRRFVRIEFVTARKAYVEQFGPAEQVAVEVADGGAQRVECRGGGGLEIERVALAHGGGAVDVAVELFFERLRRRAVFGRADVGDVAFVVRFGFGEGDARVFEVVEPLQVARRALLVVGTVEVVGVDGDGPAERLRFYPGLARADDVEPAVVGRVHAAQVVGVGGRCRSVVVGVDENVAQAVDGIVVVDRFAVGGVAFQLLADDHRDVHQVVARERIGYVADVVDRESVVAAILEVARDTLPLFVEDGQVEDVAPPDERGGGVLAEYLLQEGVLVVVGEGMDAVGFPLAYGVGDHRLPVAFVGDLVAARRLVEAARVHVELDVAARGGGLYRVQNDRLAAQPAQQVVPAVLLGRVGLVVEPGGEVGADELLGGVLADVLVDLAGRDAFLARYGAVGFYLVPGEHVGVGRKMARHGAGARRRSACERERVSSQNCLHACHRLWCYWLKNPYSAISSKYFREKATLSPLA